jgi:hypothetical protein
MRVKLHCALALLVAGMGTSWKLVGATLVDTTSSGTLDGFDLFGNGLYWWSTGYPGDEVIKARPGLIAWRPALPGISLIRSTGSLYTAVNSIFASTPQNGVVRTDSDLYFYGSSSGSSLWTVHLAAATRS